MTKAAVEGNALNNVAAVPQENEIVYGSWSYVEPSYSESNILA